ncbi:MAG: GNAT family N-acetyltransferase [Longimicrobiales bacterium]
MNQPRVDVRRNPDRARFESEVDGGTAVMTYREQDGVLELLHTEVPQLSRRRGIASAIARHALDYARERGFMVKPICPFVVRYIERNPEYADLVPAS